MALQLPEKEADEAISAEILPLIGQSQSRDEERLADLDVGHTKPHSSLMIFIKLQFVCIYLHIMMYNYYFLIKVDSLNLCAAVVRHGRPSQPHTQQLCVCGAAGSRVAVGDSPAGSGEQEGPAGADAGRAEGLTAPTHAGEPPAASEWQIYQPNNDRFLVYLVITDGITENYTVAARKTQCKGQW